jgi:phenylacetate-coenzyme A ligase PaaK-like adenylate-forming protein
MSAPRLRPTIDRVELGPGLQLTDRETGFAIELEAEVAARLDVAPREAADLWEFLDEVGLVDSGLPLAEIRRRQRRQLLASRPPRLEELRERLARCCREVPFFRARAGAYQPERLTSLEAWQAVPFMRKRDVRENFPEGLLPEGTDVARGLEDGTLTFVATSGSTADRLQLVGRVEIDRHPFGCDDLYNLAIGPRQPRTAAFTLPICAGVQCHLGESTYEERLSPLAPDLTLVSTDDPFAMAPGVVDAFCEDIARFAPEILLADGIYLQCLLRRARELGRALPSVPFVHHGFEFAHAAALRDIERQFGVRPRSEYGASEENRLALECHRGALHVRADVVHFEILDAAGPCAPGRVGAVAITTLDALMPLVRYLIGDAAAWTGVTCDCAFADWPTIDLHGRLKDMLRAGGRWISTLEIDRAIGAPDWLDFYRVIQRAADEVEVQVIPALGAAPRFDELTDRLAPLLPGCRLRCREARRFDPLRSMKIGLTETLLGGAPELMVA